MLNDSNQRFHTYKDRLISFFASAFSDNGTPSSSRLMTAISMGVVLTGYLFVCFKTHQLPDGGASAGAAALGTAPYALNRATTAWGKKQDNVSQVMEADKKDS